MCSLFCLLHLASPDFRFAPSDFSIVLNLGFILSSSLGFISSNLSVKMKMDNLASRVGNLDLTLKIGDVLEKEVQLVELTLATRIITQ